MDHPLQPQVFDPHGVKRFFENRLISEMLRLAETGARFSLNELSVWAQRHDAGADYDQLLQLIGYSVDGAPLSKACRARVDAAERASGGTTFSDGFRSGYLRAIEDARDALTGLDPEDT